MLGDRHWLKGAAIAEGQGNVEHPPIHYAFIKMQRSSFDSIPLCKLVKN